ARMTIEPFRKSTDENINLSATGFHAAYTRALKNNAEVEDRIERTLNGESEKFGTTARRFADLVVSQDEVLKLLSSAIVLATYAMVDMEALGKHARLRIGGQQRKLAIANLVKAFGPQARTMPKADFPAVWAPAIMLCKFLQEWPGGDE